MLQIQSWCLGSLQTNCYLVWDETKSAVIIDPADDPEFIAEKITFLDLNPLYILATHGHFDHILAVTGLKLIFNIPFLCHQADEFLVKSMTKRSQYWQKESLVPAPEIDQYLKNNEEINFGQSKLQVFETPGHTPGGVSFYSQEKGIVFTGDTLFNSGVGRTDLSYSSPEKLQTALDKLFQLPPETVIYPGHGESTILENELISKHSSGN